MITIKVRADVRDGGAVEWRMIFQVKTNPDGFLIIKFLMPLMMCHILSGRPAELQL